MALVGRPRKHPMENTPGQTGIIEADFQDVPLDANENRLTTPMIYPDLPEGENSKFLKIIMETEEIRRDADINDIDSLYSCLGRYLELCHKYDVRLTNLGAYRACGVSKQLIEGWASGSRRASQPEYAQFALSIRSICAEYREMTMAEGRLNPITGIWWQKNYDRFEDRPTPYSEAGMENESRSSAEIAEKYADIPDE